MATAAHRDEEFDAFFVATWARLYRTVYAVAGGRPDAEDALQAAYGKAFALWRKVRAMDHPEAYVRRIAVNEVLSSRRRGWHRFERPVGEPVPSAYASHETSTVQQDAMWRSVLQLAPRQRAVIVLRYYEDLSEQEIAEVLGCSRGTVKSTASDALARLRVLGAVDAAQEGRR